MSICMIHSAIFVSFDIFERRVGFLATMVGASALVFSLGGLLGYHTYLMMNNLSTLESD